MRGGVEVGGQKLCVGIMRIPTHSTPYSLKKTIKLRRIIHQIMIQRLNTYAALPYFPLIVQDNRDEVKEAKFRPESGYKL